MTERDLYIQLIPVISKIAVKCRELSDEEYEAWKKEALSSAPESVKKFVGKTMAAIDKARKKGALCRQIGTLKYMGRELPVMEMPQITDERWQELARENAVRNYTRENGREPESVAQAVAWQRERIQGQ